MSGAEFDAERAVKILNHPVRIRIIELLDPKGPLLGKSCLRRWGLAREHFTTT
jgi:hypothetical protein